MKVQDGNYDWNGRPIRVAGGAIEDYIGGGQWVPSKLKMVDLAKPGGDLSHWHDDAEMQRAMQRMDREAKAGK